MNQDFSNYNQNNNTDSQSMSNNTNNQPINNQSFNQEVNINNQINQNTNQESVEQINAQLMNNNFQQQYVQQPVESQQQYHQPMQNNYNTNTQSNNIPRKKSKIGLIIGITAVIVVILVVAVILMTKKSNKLNDNSEFFVINDTFNTAPAMSSTLIIDDIDGYEYFGKTEWKVKLSEKKYVINVPIIKTTDGSYREDVIGGCGFVCMNISFRNSKLGLEKDNYSSNLQSEIYYDGSNEYIVTKLQSSGLYKLELLYKDIVNNFDQSENTILVDITLDSEKDNNDILKEFAKLYNLNFEKLSNNIKKYMSADNTIVAQKEEQYKNNSTLVEIQSYQTISDSGVVIMGKVLKGQVKLGDTIGFINSKGELETAVISGIEKFRSSEDFINENEDGGILLKNVKQDKVEYSTILFSID